MARRRFEYEDWLRTRRSQRPAGWHGGCLKEVQMFRYFKLFQDRCMYYACIILYKMSISTISPKFFWSLFRPGRATPSSTWTILRRRTTLHGTGTLRRAATKHDLWSTVFVETFPEIWFDNWNRNNICYEMSEVSPCFLRYCVTSCSQAFSALAGSAG